MTIRNAVNLVSAVPTKSRFKSSSVARSCAAAGAIAPGLLVAGCASHRITDDTDTHKRPAAPPGG